MNRDLKLLDFSKGIKDEEVMYNFNLLMKLLARERLYTAGWGYVEGLKVTYEGPDEKKKYFKLHMDQGVLIDKEGYEIFLEETELYVEYFNTVKESELVEINEDGIIELKHFPYVKNGHFLLEYDKEFINEENIQVKNENTEINIKDIKGKNLIVDSRYKGIARVIYYRAEPRYDILTYNKDGVLRIHKGIESTSKSFYETYKDDIVIAIIEALPYEYPSRKNAILKITQMWEISKRKIWIDIDNDILYICGEPFDGTQIIHMERPENPKENQLWYDKQENVIKIWRTIQGVSRWLTISDKSFMRKKQRKLWQPHELPEDMQTFIFDPVKDSELIYAANTNALEITIDNSVLMSDEYVELISEEKHPDYFNQGIGFKLQNPLTQPAYVEVSVTHEKRFTPRESRFERSGVFVDEKRLPIPYEKTSFNTDTKFLKDANQLEVYLNGQKLFNKIDYDEIEIIESSDNEEKNYCQSFSLRKPVKVTDILVYKVTSNLISYNDLCVYMEDVLSFYEKAEKEKDKTKKELEKIKSELNELRSKHEEELLKVTKELESFKKILDKKISKEDLLDTLDNQLLDIKFIDEVLNTEKLAIIQQNSYKYDTKNNLDKKSLSITAYLVDDKSLKMTKLINGKDFLIDKSIIRFLNTSVIDMSEKIYIQGTTLNKRGVR